jgi:hypothetical protein
LSYYLELVGYLVNLVYSAPGRNSPTLLTLVDLLSQKSKFSIVTKDLLNILLKLETTIFLTGSLQSVLGELCSHKSDSNFDQRGNKGHFHNPPKNCALHMIESVSKALRRISLNLLRLALNSRCY